MQLNIRPPSRTSLEGLRALSRSAACTTSPCKVDRLSCRNVGSHCLVCSISCDARRNSLITCRHYSRTGTAWILAPKNTPEEILCRCCHHKSLCLLVFKGILHSRVCVVTPKLATPSLNTVAHESITRLSESTSRDRSSIPSITTQQIGKRPPRQLATHQTYFESGTWLCSLV